ncbi:hypothetical protein C461_14318 [Halorubrum aidingense JCM 13560]|uniref:DUF7096 domain-containing protein n=1 Tax=Halorubrum aidingense JCM 13560 TaxID=1230454 RepID=M0P612_9EURY|nr:hypothetical protein [Halorubrum aidingense]EMA65278.1 hypothetical protein C461_14318 [Halorubrum aidingense JCM 13560]
MQGTRLLTVLVALGLVVGSVPGGALASAVGNGDATNIDSPDAAIEGIDTTTAAAQTEDGNTTDGDATNATGGDANASETDANTSRATVGQQLATVIAVTDDEVSSDVESSSLDAALENATESERASILTERSSTLRERADDIVTEQRAARVAYEDGNITRGEFAQRLAVLAGEARTVDRGFERVDAHAADVSELELRAAEYDRSANEAARQRLNRVTGTGASALLAQYTGERAGEFSLEVDGGVSIEVENDDGERSREFERDQPGNGSFDVTQSEALATAVTQLSTDADGEWSLRSVDRDGDDGYYEFEFTFFGPETTGEAEVSVDGQTGEVFEFEEEIEPRERDDEDGDDDDETPLSISIVDGTTEPGETVTLRVTAAGEPVEGAAVELDDQDVGTTDADGRITVTLPDADEVDIEAEDGEREGELEISLGTDDGDDGDDEADAELRERLSVDGTAENGTVTVSVAYDGAGVDGVSVFVDGDRVGTTGADGSLSFDAPDVDDELEVTLVKGAFEAELEFEVGADGTLVLDDIDVDERDADDDRDDDRDDDDGSEDDDRDDADRDSDELSVAIVSGDPAPGATVTVEVTNADGEPVEGASVEIEGESVGTTDADGQIEVSLPDDDEAEIEVEDGDREGELELEFETDSDEDGDDADDDGDDADDDGDDADDDGDDDDEDDDDDDDDAEDDE